MGDILFSFLIFAGAFLLTVYVLGGVQLAGFTGAVMGAGLFGLVNALLWWFLTGAVLIAPVAATYAVLFGTRWVVGGLLLLLLDRSTKILILRNLGTALTGGLLITGIGMIGEQFLVHGP